MTLILNGKGLNNNYKIIIKLVLFNKIPIFNLNFNSLKITLRESIDKIEKLTNVKNRKINFKTLNNYKIEVKNLDLRVLIGTEDAAFTAILVGIVSSLFSIYIRKLLKQNDNNYWRITPIYQNNNLLKINLNCIISLKIIHIIYTVFNLKEEKKNDGTSNTGNYVHSYEKHKRNG